jgi:hypothetical protein
MAMVKFGYKLGLFVTNARISPQSKREYLNDYPGLTLDFTDGTELVAEVLHNVLLRAIWVTGTTIERVSYAVSIPVLARDLERDKPISLEGEVGNGTFRVRSAPSAKFEELDVRLDVTHLPAVAFEPYRAPRVKTIYEGWLPGMRVGELLITRMERLDQIRLVRWFLAQRLLRSVARAPGRSRHLALRLGVPSLTPLGGQQAGMRIELSDGPLTMVYHNGQVDTESEWLLPDYGPHWYPPDRLRASMADWVRWYNPSSDLCLGFTLISPPSARNRGMVEEQREYARRHWSSQHVFALVPPNLQSALTGTTDSSSATGRIRRAPPSGRW